MSQYAQPSDLTSVGINPAALQQTTNAQQVTALTRASGIIDGYLGSRYNLPLVAPFPGDLITRTAEIAAWFLMRSIGFNPEGSPTIRESYLDAIKWCREVSASVTTPAGIQDSTGSAALPAAPSVYSNPPRGWLNGPKGNGGGWPPNGSGGLGC